MLVLTLPMDESEVDQLSGLGVPVGSVGVPGRGVSSVGIDDVAGARIAVNHLVNLGHERIALIGGGPSEPIHFTVPHDRLAGYRSAMEEAGLPVLPGYEVDGSFTFAGGEEAMAALLSLPKPPTAVFARVRRDGHGCDAHGAAVGAALPRRRQHHRVRRPRAGRDGGPDHHRRSRCTTQGRVAAEMLLARIAGAEPATRTVPTRLVLRASTSPPRPRNGRR